MGGRNTGARNGARWWRRLSPPGALPLAADERPARPALAGDLASLAVDAERRARDAQRLQRAEHLAGLGILAAGMAHEIATPLTCIGAHAEALLRREDVGPAERDRLESIVGQTAIASRLVRGLLDLARAREVRPRPTDVQRLAEGVLALHRDRMEALGVSATVVDESGDPVAWLDGDRLHQVLVILVTNSLDASPDGGRLEIRLRRAADDGARAIFAIDVLDSGVGIAPQDLPRLTEPFFSTKGRARGVGLGLHVAQQILEAHGGTLRIESARHQGTTVHLELPARTSDGE